MGIMEPIRRVPAACFYVFPLPNECSLIVLMQYQRCPPFFGLSYKFSSEQCAKENHAQIKETLNPTTQAYPALPQNRQNMDIFRRTSICSAFAGCRAPRATWRRAPTLSRRTQRGAPTPTSARTPARGQSTTPYFAGRAMRAILSSIDHLSE